MFLKRTSTLMQWPPWNIIGWSFLHHWSNNLLPACPLSPVQLFVALNWAYLALTLTAPREGAAWFAFLLGTKNSLLAMQHSQNSINHWIHSNNCLQQSFEQQCNRGQNSIQSAFRRIFTLIKSAYWFEQSDTWHQRDDMGRKWNTKRRK